MARRGPSPAPLIGAPLVMLLIGGGVGWFTRDSGGTSASGGTVVGRPMPSGAELDAQAPLRSLPSAPNTMVIDQRQLIGFPESEATVVPRGGALPPHRWRPRPRGADVGAMVEPSVEEAVVEVAAEASEEAAPEA